MRGFNSLRVMPLLGGDVIKYPKIQHIWDTFISANSQSNLSSCSYKVGSTGCPISLLTTLLMLVSQLSLAQLSSA
jgi:hypothetical protein